MPPNIVIPQKVVFSITADRDYWPTVTDALSEVKVRLAEDPKALVRGEDGIVPATLVASLLEDAVKREPGAKLRPLGWKHWPAR